MSETTSTGARKSMHVKTVGLMILPILLLIGVIGLFLATNGAGLHGVPAAPVESLTFDKTVLQPNEINLYIRNTSPQPITIATVNINDAIWPFTAEPGPSLKRFEQAVVYLQYPWVRGEAYEITLHSTSSIPFVTSIPVAAPTKTPDAGTLLSFTLIGLYVGVIPVLLGITWFPALRRAGPATFTFLMALTVGLLIFLGIDATNEALEVAKEVGGPFQGIGLVGIGIVITFMLLDALTRRQVGIGRSEATRRLTLAMMIAVGIGLHNLGEG
jgi:ZIP family zinc transporter